MLGSSQHHVYQSGVVKHRKVAKIQEQKNKLSKIDAFLHYIYFSVNQGLISFVERLQNANDVDSKGNQVSTTTDQLSFPEKFGDTIETR